MVRGVADVPAAERRRRRASAPRWLQPRWARLTTSFRAGVVAILLAAFNYWAASLLWLGGSACAEDAYRDYRRTLFVAQQAATSLTAVDIDADILVGRLEIGLEPRELQISQRGGQLVAIDLRQPQVALVDLASRGRRLLPLSLVPTRVRISPDGERLAVFDDHRGSAILIGRADGREIARVDGPRDIREAIFSDDGKALLIAADSFEGIAVYDTTNAQHVATLHGPPLAALLRGPNGREGFALSSATPRTILHLDLKALKVLATVAVGEAATIVPTRTGIQVVALDPVGGTLSILPAEPLQPGVTLPSAAGASVAYAAWFDTTAFVPDPTARKLLIYDLERKRTNGAISIDGTPATGIVTPDGDKLYLPIEQSEAITVIDTHLRRRSASIALGFKPTQVIIAGGYGLCH